MIHKEQIGIKGAERDGIKYPAPPLCGTGTKFIGNWKMENVDFDRSEERFERTVDIIERDNIVYGTPKNTEEWDDIGAEWI
jgi:hypothetical protein